MLFTQYIQETRYNEITRIEQEIARLQQLLTDLQSAVQTDLALEQMADSAIEQLQIAVNNILSRNPELRPILKTAAIRVLDTELPMGILTDGAIGNSIGTDTPQPEPGDNNGKGNWDRDDGEDDSDNDPDDDNDPPTPPTPPNGGGGSDVSEAEESERITTIDIAAQTVTEQSAPAPMTPPVDAPAPENSSNNTEISLTNTPVPNTPPVPVSSSQPQSKGVPIAEARTKRSSGKQKAMQLPPARVKVVIDREGADESDILTEKDIAKIPLEFGKEILKALGISIRSSVSTRLPGILLREEIVWATLEQIAQDLDPVLFDVTIVKPAPKRQKNTTKMNKAA